MTKQTSKRTKTSKKTTTSPPPAAGPTEVPVLNPAVVASMQETLARLISTAQWIESTATTLQNRLRSVEQWFQEFGPDVRLNGRASSGYVDYVAQARKG
jgi:hypothetical protein